MRRVLRDVRAGRACPALFWGVEGWLSMESTGPH